MKKKYGPTNGPTFRGVCPMPVEMAIDKSKKQQDVPHLSRTEIFDLQVNQYAAAVQGAAALGAYTHQPTTTPLQFYPGTNTTLCWVLLYQYSGAIRACGFKL